MNIGGSLHYTAAVVPIIGHPLSLFATFRPLTAAGFESCILQPAATTAGQATHYLLPTFCTA